MELLRVDASQIFLKISMKFLARTPAGIAPSPYPPLVFLALQNMSRSFLSSVSVSPLFTFFVVDPFASSRIEQLPSGLEMFSKPLIDYPHHHYNLSLSSTFSNHSFTSNQSPHGFPVSTSRRSCFYHIGFLFGTGIFSIHLQSQFFQMFA